MGVLLQVVIGEVLRSSCQEAGILVRQMSYLLSHGCILAWRISLLHDAKKVPMRITRDTPLRRATYNVGGSSSHVPLDSHSICSPFEQLTWGTNQEECSLVPDRCLKYLRQLHTQRICSQLQSDKKF
jgi:hypothetical protein